MPATLTAQTQDFRRMTRPELKADGSAGAKAELERRSAKRQARGKAWHENAEAEVDRALESVLELFESDELPSALAHTVIRRLESDAPSSSWSVMNNLLMILGGTTDARGRRQWEAAGREVNKDAKPIFILGPKMVTYKVENEETGEEETHRRMKGFVGIAVYAVEDTTGDPIVVPDYTPAELPPLADAAERLGVDVSYFPTSSSYWGAYFPGSREVKLMTSDESTFYHELAHAAHDSILRAKGSSLKGGQHAGQEIVAELTAATLCRLVDRDTPGTVRRSRDYIDAYAKGNRRQAIAKVLSEVQGCLELILGAAS